MRTSSSPTTVMTANGEVQTREEATVYVKELDLFVTVMLFEEIPAVLSMAKLCEDHGYTYHSGQKPHLIRNGKRIDCNFSNYVPFVVPGLPTSSSSPTSSPTSPSSSSQESISANQRKQRYWKSSIRKKWTYEWRASEKPAARICRSTKRFFAWIAWLATGIQRELGWWQYFNRALGKPRAGKSRHFQDVSWSSNGAASKSGTGFL